MKSNENVTQEFLNYDGLYTRWTVEYSMLDLNDFSISDGESLIYLQRSDVEPLIRQLTLFEDALKALEVESVKKDKEEDVIPF